MSGEAELRIWMTSGGEPFVFELSNEQAEGTYGVIGAAWEHALPAGAVGFNDGTMIAIRAIAAVRVTLAERSGPRPTGGWVATAPSTTGT